MSRTMVVTGAHGFIGRHAARHFFTLGWQVVGIGHGAWASDEWKLWGLSAWHCADITQDTLLKYAGSPDVIIHCAGGSSVGASVTHPEQDFERTVDTTVAVLEFLRHRAPQALLVYPSSASVYGVAAELPIAESDALNPVSPYGVHKKLAEELCCSYASRFGIPAVVLRMFSVYGRALRKQLLWDACNKISRGNPTFFGTGDELRDWIHVQDVTAMMEAVIRTRPTSQCQILNVGTGVGVTVREVLGHLLQALGYSGSPEFTGTAKAGDPPRYVADVGRAKELAWQAKVSWKDGISDYAKWFAEEVR